MNWLESKTKYLLTATGILGVALAGFTQRPIDMDTSKVTSTEVFERPATQEEKDGSIEHTKYIGLLGTRHDVDALLVNGGRTLQVYIKRFVE